MSEFKPSVLKLAFIFSLLCSDLVGNKLISQIESLLLITVVGE